MITFSFFNANDLGRSDDAKRRKKGRWPHKHFVCDNQMKKGSAFQYIGLNNTYSLQCLISLAFSHLLICSFPAASRITGRLRPVNSKRRRRMALLLIDVKFGTMKDYRINQSLAEFH